MIITILCKYLTSELIKLKMYFVKFILSTNIFPNGEHINIFHRDTTYTIEETK
jgi:hypothetical protein